MARPLPERASLSVMKIGDRIRAARASVGLTQREFAKALGVTHGMVGQWEAHIAEPGKEMLFKIAEYTTTDPRTLLHGNPAQNPAILVQEPRQIAMLRMFNVLSERQQQNLLELLSMTVHVPLPADEPDHAPEPRPARAKRGTNLLR